MLELQARANLQTRLAAMPTSATCTCGYLLKRVHLRQPATLDTRPRRPPILTVYPPSGVRASCLPSLLLLGLRLAAPAASRLGPQRGHIRVAQAAAHLHRPHHTRQCGGQAPQALEPPIIQQLDAAAACGWSGRGPRRVRRGAVRVVCGLAPLPVLREVTGVLLHQPHNQRDQGGGTQVPCAEPLARLVHGSGDETHCQGMLYRRRRESRALGGAA